MGDMDDTGITHESAPLHFAAAAQFAACAEAIARAYERLGDACFADAVRVGMDLKLRDAQKNAAVHFAMAFAALTTPPRRARRVETCET